VTKQIRRQLSQAEKNICEKQIRRFKQDIDFYRYELKRKQEDRLVGLPLTIKKKERELDAEIRGLEAATRELNVKTTHLQSQVRDGVVHKIPRKQIKLFGYNVLEDEEVEELVLPKRIIELLQTHGKKQKTKEEKNEDKKI